SNRSRASSTSTTSDRGSPTAKYNENLVFCRKAAPAAPQNETIFQRLRSKIRYSADQRIFSADQRIEAAITTEKQRIPAVEKQRIAAPLGRVSPVSRNASERLAEVPSSRLRWEMTQREFEGNGHGIPCEGHT